MPLLPHGVRSDIARASFHALEGDPKLVPEIAARIDAALAGFDPADAPRLAAEIDAALHRIALPRRGRGAGPLSHMLRPLRARRLDRLERTARARCLSLPACQPELGYLFACHADPEIRAAALAALPPAPGPVHTALARHARESPDGGRA